MAKGSKQIMSEYCKICKSFVDKACDGSSCSCERFEATVPLRRERAFKYV